MYMPGRFRTASSPSRTERWRAEYSVDTKNSLLYLLAKGIEKIGQLTPATPSVRGIRFQRNTGKNASSSPVFML
jgi:hypothetical protein